MQIGPWLEAAEQRSKARKDDATVLITEYGKTQKLKFEKSELEMHDGCDKQEQLDIYALLEVYDEMTGMMLDPMLIQESRKVELGEVHKHKV